MLRNYAPTTTQIGFHFQPYDVNIFTPVIRKQVRDCEIEELDHYTVYLPSFDDKHLLKKLSHFKYTTWHVFSKHSKESYQVGNVIVKPITNSEFVEDMAKSKGVFCGAGFETPAEALYLKKKLMVIPMKGQYEQQCNATALGLMGVPVINSLKKKHFDKIGQWLESEEKIEVDYPDQTRMIVRKVFEMNVQMVLENNNWVSGYQLTLKTKDYKKVAL
jgi:uncharacterized protein (TIGR00661 family)